MGAATVAVVVAGAAVQPAVATDLESLRNRAQKIADQVTALEHRLAGLGEREGKLNDEIEAVSREIGVLEEEIDDAQTSYDAALEDYAAKAVELYKAGPMNQLALLLSADDLSDLYAIDLATSVSTREAEEALEELLAIRDAAVRAQERVEERKQKLITAQAKVTTIKTEMARTVSTRRATLKALTEELRKLEAEARRQAASLAGAPGSFPGSVSLADESLLDLLRPTGPSDGIPKEFVGTGVTFEGIASWYGPGFEGNPTANGDTFDPNLYTAASKELPLGSWLYVEHEGRGVVVYVNDRGPYVEGRILDLSRAAAFAIGIDGIGWIEAEILIKP